MIVTQTPRLTLRYASLDDVVAMRAIFADPEVMQYGDGPQTDDWIRSWIQRMNRNYNEHGFGLWIVSETDEPNAIGYCGLTHFPDINGRAEIEVGYRLARKYWGCGFATEAAAAVRDYAFNDLDIERLIAIINPENQRSVRVAEKLGMELDSTVMLDGYNHVDSVYVCRRE